jgi:hypothetical protein
MVSHPSLQRREFPGQFYGAAQNRFAATEKPGHPITSRPGFPFGTNEPWRPLVSVTPTSMPLFGVQLSSGPKGLHERLLLMKRQKAANDNRKTKFTDEEAIDVWLRFWKGDLQDDIAHDYRINAGRVSDVVNEKTHPGSRTAAEKLRKKSA